MRCLHPPIKASVRSLTWGEIKLFPPAGGRCSHVKLLLPAYEELIRKPAELCDYSAASPTKEALDSGVAAILKWKMFAGGGLGRELWLSPLDWVKLPEERPI